MSEQENMDHLLRQMMASQPQPSLSPAFDRRLMKELRPSRLTAAGRLLLVLYALLALAVSAWVLRAFAWPAVAIAILAPLILALAIQSRQRTPVSRSRHPLRGR